MRELQGGDESRAESDDTGGCTRADPERGNTDGSPPPQLVSVPLIVITGHGWEVFFACDEGGAITVRGPVSLGSTRNIVKKYLP
ncbi:hypothetical protein GGS24DRAFT_485483 [Hypoxylon argillaceum]|nr:hypothetical protein GGS24DRAFT_485483 [Hypoxylon argillaceum]